MSSQRVNNDVLARFAVWLGRLRTIYLGLGIVGFLMIQIVGLRILRFEKVLGLYEPLHWTNYWIHLGWLTMAGVVFLVLEQFVERKRPNGRTLTLSGVMANTIFAAVVFALVFATG